MLLRLLGYLPSPVLESAATATDSAPTPVLFSPEPIETYGTVAFGEGLLAVPTAPMVTPTFATLLPEAPLSPASEWAEMLLDRALSHLPQAPPLQDGLAWWEGSGAAGRLDLDGAVVTVGGRPVDVDSQRRIDVMLPDVRNPIALTAAGSITYEADALTLTVDRGEATDMQSRWILAGMPPSRAIRALVEAADARDVALDAAFIENPGRQGTLALVGLVGATPTPTLLLPSPGGPTPTASLTPSPTWTPLPPTPTRVPDPYMGRIIAERLAPVIEAAAAFNPHAVYFFAENHPWIGILTWTERGSTIGGRPSAVSQAEELTFYTLQANEPSPSVVSFLYIFYADGATRFPDDLVYFPSHRMEEALFWMVRAAAEEGGQLVVAYDDFGAKQAITVIGFRPFDTGTDG